MLRPLILTLNDNPRGKMRDPDGGRGLVNVLAAGARRPVGGNTDILILDLDIQILLQLRHDITG